MIRLFFVCILTFSGLVGAQPCDSDAVASQLRARASSDQNVRNRAQEDRSEDAVNEVLRVDAENTKWMSAMLEACGWPKRTIVGDVAVRDAWLLTQHADANPKHQIYAAGLLKKAVLAGEADGQHLALLVDRNRMLQEQPQSYGMQYRKVSIEPAIIEFLPIEFPERLDRRREEIGLTSFSCWAGKVSIRENALLVWPSGVLFIGTLCGD